MGTLRGTLSRTFAGALLLGTAVAAYASGAAHPRFIYILLSTEPGAPTPQQVAEGFDFSSGTTPPLEGLRVENPRGAYYLLPLRAKGEFKAFLDANPDMARAKLERFLIVGYGPDSNMTQARRALEDDEFIESVTIPLELDFAVPPGRVLAPGPHIPQGASTQYGRDAMNIELAWNFERGHALVGLADSGLATSHPDLVPFSGGQFVGGNYLSAYAIDVGSGPLAIDFNVDEAEPQIIANPTTDCDPDGNGIEIPDFAGHGTHTSGIVAANATNGDGVSGSCRHCGLAMAKISFAVCGANGIITPTLNFNGGIASALTYLADFGAQVFNLSFGGQVTPVDYCPTDPNHPICLAITYANARDVVVVGASGNSRTRIQWPARDPRSVAAGGFDANLALWNEDPDAPPNHLNNCPIVGSDAECGSNFTTVIGERRQEDVGAARQVLSTTYPNFNWNPNLSCGDAFGGPTGDGFGNCTGTSMSSPYVAAVAGLLRSANPLLVTGDPETAIDFGVRDVIATTTAEAQLGTAWSQQFGYGRPDALRAVNVTLGTVGGLPVRNRLTPLFGLYSTAATDYAYVVAPQAAMALIVPQTFQYAPTGTLVAGYTAFPRAAADPVPPAPRASAFIFTTHNKPFYAFPALVPIYWLDRPRNFPVGCTTGQPGCNSANRDFLLTTSTTELVTMTTDGYAYRGMLGYVFGTCGDEPTCIPAGTERLYRQCNTNEDDCAVFLESERTAFETAGYTAAYPAGSSTVIGYAYPNVDADADTLIDGLERVVGTNPNSTDSDGDAAADNAEFPLRGVSISDPCQGPNVTCAVTDLFMDGFES